VVAPGPVDNIYRILVGPFPNSTALEETRSLIKSSGVEPILRSY
jgi:cell division protein FtsN